ncbi:MAG: 3-deoxy-manno-octulosonate cytidylyltransferase [Candidatus Marinimicrobia bacterium]|jgi:3-deoxy-manno-octulosonate cytidylyltransferase (CMP-KDO synthetase)|nr:3-deoxy-manno-octulosonate cytidylyltransferase [Candidatus Neomarinimicrobiota bacterium]MBT6936809.1 3-deoxy-manno-octulosonate cytidylyltransferase [Candidatus Neomarinimicrobiota bacterium]MBT7270469.1 3-deoxy-manno-octulosonate cytidylyltransferase [Candidatus Neomarinimicrobiota bacterium]
MSDMKIVAIIPARMDSSRYPGKPLIDIEGLPMIEHVRRRTLMCNGFEDVIVATCDQDIFDVVKHFNGNVVMTSNEHIMASDRVAEVAEKMDCTHVINVQGDEILILPEDLSKMVKAINASPENMYWNATAPIDNEDELFDPSIVKCVINQQKKIMYCARDFSSLKNLNGSFEPVRKILGILGYSKNALLNYSGLHRSPLEITQSIDQSRIIENDFPLFSVPFSVGFPGINDIREEKMVKVILKTNKRQKEILEQILN